MDQQKLFKVYTDTCFVKASTKEEAVEKVRQALQTGAVPLKAFEATDEHLL